MSGDLAIVDREIAGIQETMRADIGAYARNEALQGRYLDLLRAKDTGGSAPPPIASRALELQAIREAMRDSNSAYYKGQQVTKLDRETGFERTETEMSWRFLELLQGDKPAPAADNASDDSDDGDDVPYVKLPKGATDADMRIMHRANDVIAALPRATRHEFMRGFESQPADVLAACRDELAAQPPFSGRADATDIERFGSTPEGRACLKAWGEDAPVRLGRLQARLRRWQSRMAPATAYRAMSWLDSLDPGEAVALYKALTA